jgi:aspartate aminotransferase-like enzyme
MTINTRMHKLIEATETPPGEEPVEPALLDLAKDVALGAKNLGLTDVDELAMKLKQLSQKKTVLKRAMQQMGQTGKATKLARDYGAFAVIDAISSLGGYAIPVDRWGVDMCITGSQKCIAAPPGLALLSVTKGVVDFLKESPPKTRYFEIPRYLEYGTRGETPFTPALPLFYALDEALKELLEEGLANRVQRHDRMSALLYDGLAGQGLNAVAEKSVRSKTVVASYYPPGVDDSKFRKALSNDKGVVIAGGFGPFKGRVFRIGCMGQINEGLVQTTLKAISETLAASRN